VFAAPNSAALRSPDSQAAFQLGSRLALADQREGESVESWKGRVESQFRLAVKAIERKGRKGG